MLPRAVGMGNGRAPRRRIGRRGFDHGISAHRSRPRWTDPPLRQGNPSNTRLWAFAHKQTSSGSMCRSDPPTFASIMLQWEHFGQPSNRDRLDSGGRPSLTRDTKPSSTCSSSSKCSTTVNATRPDSDIAPQLNTPASSCHDRHDRQNIVSTKAGEGHFDMRLNLSLSATLFAFEMLLHLMSEVRRP